MLSCCCIMILTTQRDWLRCLFPVFLKTITSLYRRVIFVPCPPIDVRIIHNKKTCFQCVKALSTTSQRCTAVQTVFQHVHLHFPIWVMILIYSTCFCNKSNISDAHLPPSRKKQTKRFYWHKLTDLFWQESHPISPLLKKLNMYCQIHICKLTKKCLIWQSSAVWSLL